MWTSALVHILKGLGFEEQTARQAIARASSSDWIVAERQGREVKWSLSRKLVHIFETGSGRVYSLSDPFTSWDGTWPALSTTIPQSHRSARRPLYAGLTWAGLGNPTPRLWLTPHVERADEVGRLIEGLGLKEHIFAFIGKVSSLGIPHADIVERGWDLKSLQSHYEQVLAAITELHPSDDDETLLAHVRMISEWQEFPRTDPQLPEALLPDWIGRRIARRIEALRAQWTPAARKRFAEINAGGVNAAADPKC
ncbi:PaaX family transcriptional regulator C-terminal domain-containing protein [Streptomyces sp. NPDC058424]|uniref:PaaX family transcriptional regulator n=1 Tax=Streptomyces sp. NPDC058424 TaxID=3346491 RepID=UPI00366839A6